MSDTPNPHRRRAVVIGASMAGLCAARVLADHFAEVIVLDRDELPAEPVDRRGVGQSRHFHSLLAAGQQRLEAWFPGLKDALIASGAMFVDCTGDIHSYQGGAARLRCRSDIQWPVCSRALIEHHVRARVAALPGVVIRANAIVSNLTSTDGGSRITGITLEDGTSFTADLVVDATGRSARSLRWLQALGHEPPPTEVVTVNVGYASRVVRWGGSNKVDWRAAMVAANPPQGRLAVAIPMEGDRWMITLAGYHGDHAPTDDEGFLAFARSFPSPVVAELLAEAEHLGPVSIHRVPSSQWHRVDQLRRVPSGLVLLGDSICSFNPVYGQGMTSAALQAEALGATLAQVQDSGEQFVRAFYQRTARIVNGLWQMAAGGDFTFPGTTGRKPPGLEIVRWYMQRVALAVQVSAPVNMRVAEVTNLLRSPASLLTPAMMLEIMRAARKAAAGTQAPEAR